MDGEAPALQFVVKVENRTLIFCSSFPGKCSANDTKMIHHLTKVIVEGQASLFLLDTQNSVYFIHVYIL